MIKACGHLLIFFIHILNKKFILNFSLVSDIYLPRNYLEKKQKEILNV